MREDDQEKWPHGAGWCLALAVSLVMWLAIGLAAWWWLG